VEFVLKQRKVDMSADADTPRMKRKVYEKELEKLQVVLC
jgi:hypothetical protein